MNKVLRDQATNTLESFKLDGNNATLILEYIGNESVPEQNRQMAAITLKNIIKKVYGGHSYTHYDDKDNGEVLTQEDPTNFINEDGKNVLMAKLLDLMMFTSSCGKPKITNIVSEVIALMGRKYVQNDWPSLFAGIINYLSSSQDLAVFKTIFECVKKICKKYRYMFRSDALYSEMNYVIENLSNHMLSALCNCLNMAKDEANSGNEELIKSLYCVMNSIMHIIESILSQEELPDFYENNLQVIMDACQFILSHDFPKFP